MRLRETVSEQPSLHFWDDSIRLIQFANQFKTKNYDPPVPLRRTCSILRSYGFNSIVCEAIKIDLSSNVNNVYCEADQCGDKYLSCNEYIELINKHYERKIISKECYKIAFFKQKITSKENLLHAKNSDLLAYCIVHIDSFLNDGMPEDYRPYVTESILGLTERRKSQFYFNSDLWHIFLNRKKFKITGNYFCQQNSITNCCANAAIKMAVRCNRFNITAETINKYNGINHIDRKGNSGFKPNEFVNVLEEITKSKCELHDIRSLSTPLHFLKLVYHALESRFPVILLFASGRHGSHKNYNSGNTERELHAAALAGHTFNKDNWWAYAWKGYFTKSRTSYEYLPSVLWCDNFIIQDDNYGPQYLLPVHSLKTTELWSLLPRPIKSLSQTTRFNMSKILKRLGAHRAALNLYRPVYCIITYPHDLPSFCDVMWIEPSNLEFLGRFVDRINLIPTLNFNVFYMDYFLHNFKKKDLVLRTYALNKNEYIDSLKKYKQSGAQDLNIDHIIDSLPNMIWVTDISIPELYWINHKKIGEIVTIPPDNRKNLNQATMNIRVIKLPGLISVIDSDGDSFLYGIDNGPATHDLIQPSGITS